MKLYDKFKIIVGSQSPRRHYLMKEAGFKFQIDIRPTEEVFDPQMPVEEVAEFLACQKSKEFEHDLSSDQLVLTADSIVVLDQKIYGKPKDRKDAFNIINEIQGNTHLVYTGVSLLSSQKRVSFTDITKVTIEIMTPEEIDFYIDQYKPFDKAGAYGIQDWIGFCKVCKIEGSYANVMGLPIHRVYKEILNF